MRYTIYTSKQEYAFSIKINKRFFDTKEKAEIWYKEQQEKTINFLKEHNLKLSDETGELMFINDLLKHNTLIRPKDVLDKLINSENDIADGSDPEQNKNSNIRNAINYYLRQTLYIVPTCTIQINDEVIDSDYANDTFERYSKVNDFLTERLTKMILNDERITIVKVNDIDVEQVIVFDLFNTHNTSNEKLLSFDYAVKIIKDPIHYSIKYHPTVWTSILQEAGEVVGKFVTESLKFREMLKQFTSFSND